MPPAALAAIAREVEVHLAELFRVEGARWSALDPDLADPLACLEHLVVAGGKRLRPAFAHWGFRCAGGHPTDRAEGQDLLLDAAEVFPFDDATVDRIHTEHMIEHVDHPVGTHMLAECARILKPGGRIRILTPDFDRVIALTGDIDPEVATLARESNLRNGIDPAVADDPIYAVNRLFSGYGHRFLYTEAALTAALEAAGLTNVRRYPVGDTEDPDFADVDQHGNQINEGWNDYQTLVLEAEKPS